MAGATNGGGNGANGGGKVISLPLQYFCVLAVVVVAVMVLSLAFMSPAAMVAVRQNLGSVAAASAGPPPWSTSALRSRSPPRHEPISPSPTGLCCGRLSSSDSLCPFRSVVSNASRR